VTHPPRSEVASLLEICQGTVFTSIAVFLKALKELPNEVFFSFAPERSFRFSEHIFCLLENPT
jgi:hypothetical protein